jgi:hypothetical protein
MKNPSFSYCFLVLFIVFSAGSAVAQKFEGTLTYNIRYIPKSTQVKAGDLEQQYGNKEIVSISNAFYKAVRQCDDKVLKTSIYDNAARINYIQPKNASYWIKDLVASDISKNLHKLDNNAVVGEYNCNMYYFEKTALKVTFYVSQDKYAGNNPTNSWYNYPTRFMGPVVKLIVVNPDFTMIQELTSVDAKTLDGMVFETRDDAIVIPSDEITNITLEPAKRRELLQCLYKSIGYPGFLEFNKTEGKIVVELLIDQTGALKNTYIRTEYFKKQDESIRIYNTKKILSLEHKTLTKVMPLVKQCVTGYKFEAPVSGGIKVNTLFRIPFTFSKNAADVAEDNLDLDEQDIDDAFYDDFDEFY